MTSHYLNQCWIVYWRMYASLGLNELTMFVQCKKWLNLWHIKWVGVSCMGSFVVSQFQLEMVFSKWQVTFSCGQWVNTLRPRQNGRHFADAIFKCIFLNKNVSISIKISLNFVLKCSINNIPALVQIMAWRRPGDKPLSEPIMVKILTHICVTWPQWVKAIGVQWAFEIYQQ